MQVARCTDDARSLALWRPLLHGRRRLIYMHATLVLWELGEGEGVGFVARREHRHEVCDPELDDVGLEYNNQSQSAYFFFSFHKVGWQLMRYGVCSHPLIRLTII